jgi:hypothetical protein
MPGIPSNIPFVSFLQYAPQGASNTSLISKAVVLQIKVDGFYAQKQIIPYAIERLEQNLTKLEEHRDWFSPSTFLVPVPRSAPIVVGGVWPSHRICEELKNRKLGGHILPCLRRTVAIQKSATARGNRPGPIDHYNSVEVDDKTPLLFQPERILLVDDVVTRGSTFLGMVPRLQESFPDADILCFGLVRTMSKTEIDSMAAPVSGHITFVGMMPHREP